MTEPSFTGGVRESAAAINDEIATATVATQDNRIPQLPAKPDFSAGLMLPALVDHSGDSITIRGIDKRFFESSGPVAILHEKAKAAHAKPQRRKEVWFSRVFIPVTKHQEQGTFQHESGLIDSLKNLGAAFFAALRLCVRLCF